MALIDELIKEGWLKTPSIIRAFKKIKRIDFLPKNLEDLAQANEALPIGCGQTISQPLVVAFMLELLSPKPGEKILDVGSGSGWTTALLAQIVSSENKKGKVLGIEIIPELMEFGKKNVEKYNFIEKGIVEFFCCDGSKSFEGEAPFDKILCSASVQKEIPNTWKEQLKIGGKIVTPIGTSIFLFIKKTKTEFEKIEYPGFVFVPLIEK
ncbi:protein-L-isoaspartate O-methyltransferase [Parcubacteria bacterium DG_74_2]|nr:MAG: protein-L-isoaspartate O-methyltransferase [Parcubacteria bacterium DG_74_2]